MTIQTNIAAAVFAALALAQEVTGQHGVNPHAHPYTGSIPKYVPWIIGSVMAVGLTGLIAACTNCCGLFGNSSTPNQNTQSTSATHLLGVS